jgi:hypothetical protein
VVAIGSEGEEGIKAAEVDIGAKADASAEAVSAEEDPGPDIDTRLLGPNDLRA